jgi:hypothetical protein
MMRAVQDFRDPEPLSRTILEQPFALQTMINDINLTPADLCGKINVVALTLYGCFWIGAASTASPLVKPILKLPPQACAFSLVTKTPQLSNAPIKRGGVWLFVSLLQKLVALRLESDPSALQTGLGTIVACSATRTARRPGMERALAKTAEVRMNTARLFSWWLSERLGEA